MNASRFKQSHEYAYDLSSDCKNNTGRHWSKEKMVGGGGEGGRESD